MKGIRAKNKYDARDTEMELTGQIQKIINIHCAPSIIIVRIRYFPHIYTLAGFPTSVKHFISP
jgi:hypothetical protein